MDSPIDTANKVPCPECGELYHKRSLTRHLNCHKGGYAEWHECDFPSCHFGALQKGDLTRHRLAHTGEKPYKCPDCRKRFSQEIHVMMHYRIHTGEMPYRCLVEGCSGYRARQANHMTRYFQLHHRELSAGDRKKLLQDGFTKPPYSYRDIVDRAEPDTLVLHNLLVSFLREINWDLAERFLRRPISSALEDTQLGKLIAVGRSVLRIESTDAGKREKVTKSRKNLA